MRATYRAVLHGNRLEWRDEEPEDLLPGRDVEIIVTILDHPESDATSRRGPAMAAALERLAAAGGPKTFGEPAEWERETRTERAIPGREP